MPEDRSSDEATLRFYADKAEAYVASGLPVSRNLHDFLKKLLPGARILELAAAADTMPRR
jgi:hypothetical protein